MRMVLATLLMLVVTLSAAPACADYPDTLVRIMARVDAAGRTEVALHKAYGGQLGQVNDVITLPVVGPDGWPKYEYRANGTARVTEDRGRLLVGATGPGLGEVDVFVSYSRPEVSWWVQNIGATGTGTVLLNVLTELPPGVTAKPDRNGVTVLQGERRERIFTRIQPGWQANREAIPGDAALLLELNAPVQPTAPLWWVKASLGMAGASLALSIYLLWQQRRRTNDEVRR